MPGYFSYPFGDDEATGFFGGYRPPQSAPTDPDIMPVSDTTFALPEEVPTDTLTYPNGKQVVDPFGNPYPRPPGLDMQRNLFIGDSINDQFQNSVAEGFPVSRDLLFAPFFPAGAMMDYKRPDGMSGPVERRFRPVSYYNYGVMAAKAGYGKDEALQNAGLYNRMFGGEYFGANAIHTLLGHPPRFTNPYGLDGDDAEEFIKQGFDDYTNGSWTLERTN